MNRATLLLSMSTLVAATACATAGDDSSYATADGTSDAGGASAESGGDAMAADASNVTAAQACDANASGYCQHLAQCFPEAVRANWGDVAACVAAVAPSCRKVLEAPGDGWTPDSLMGCVHAREQLACDRFLVRKPELPECATRGTIDDGAGCRWGAQCKSGYCRIASGECGTCVTPVAKGGACTGPWDCAGDLLCAKNGTCEPPIAVAAMGATCDDAHPCALGSACIGGACNKPGGPGASCDPALGGIDCDYYQWSYCDGTAKKCVKYAFAAAGQSCSVPSQATICEAGGGCLNGTCAAPGPEGTLCDPSKGITCASPLSCDQGMCKLVDATECQ